MEIGWPPRPDRVAGDVGITSKRASVQCTVAASTHSTNPNMASPEPSSRSSDDANGLAFILGRSKSLLANPDAMCEALNPRLQATS